MTKTPKIACPLDAEEATLIAALEDEATPVVCDLTPARRLEIEIMARAAMSDEREKISLRIP